MDYIECIDLWPPASAVTPDAPDDPDALRLHVDPTTKALHFIKNGGTKRPLSPGEDVIPTSGKSGAVGSLVGAPNRVWSKAEWTPADINAGLALHLFDFSGPMIVHRVLLEILTQAAGVTTLHGSVGVIGSDFIDHLVASDLKAVAGTIYGSTLAELGTALQTHLGDTLWGGATMRMGFAATGGALADVTDSAGVVYVEHSRLP